MRAGRYSETSEQRTLWDQYKFKWFVPCIEVVLFKRFQSHYIDRGDKIWVFSFVHCGEVFNTVSLFRRVLFESYHCIVNITLYILHKIMILHNLPNPLTAVKQNVTGQNQVQTTNDIPK